MNITETIGTIDPETGVVTVLGPVETLQDDIDQLYFDGTSLVGLDVLVGSGAELYDVNLATGQTTFRASLIEEINRLAYEPGRGRLFGATARENPRRLVEINPATGVVTPIANTHTDTEYNGKTIDAIFFAPEPSCP